MTSEQKKLIETLTDYEKNVIAERYAGGMYAALISKRHAINIESVIAYIVFIEESK